MDDGKGEPWGFGNADEPKYRSIDLDAEGRGLGGASFISDLDKPVMKSIDIMGPADDAAYVNDFWGGPTFSSQEANFELHSNNIGLDGLAMPTLKQQAQQSAAPSGGDSGFKGKAKTFDQFASNFQGGVQAAVLSPLPVYVEKYTSFYSNTEPLAVLNLLCAVFTAADNVDHEAVPAEFKVRGVAFCPGGRFNFHVRCYQPAAGEGACMVEFQRRSGSVTEFSAFYRRSLDALGEAHVARPYMAVPKRSAGGKEADLLRERAAAMRAESAAELVVLDADTIKALCEMAMGPGVEMQREAVRALASVTNSATNQAKLVDLAKTGNALSCPCLISVLTTALSSGDDTAVRYAAQLLSHVAAQPCCRPEVLGTDKLMGALCAQLDSPSALANRDTKRLLTCALATLSKEAKEAALLKQSECPQILERFRECADSVLQANCQTVLRQLSSC